MRVLCCISSLEGGGAERVMATLANGLTSAGHVVHVVTFLPRAPGDYALDPRVGRHSLEVGTGAPTLLTSAARNLTRIARLRAVIRATAPDVLLSFMEAPNIVSILAARLERVPVVVSERIDPRAHRVGWPWRLLRRLLYPRADAVVVQTESVAAGWARGFVAQDRVHVLPNPLSLPVREAPRPSDQREPVVLAAGRLEQQKGFDTLIDAFRLVRRERPNLRLEIAGEGSERAVLEARAEQVGDGIRLLGRVNDVADRAARATVFALSSRFEGFPNVMLEALAVGTPVAATDCPSGPREILQDSAAGILARPDDPEDLARAILRAAEPSQHAVRSAAALRIAARYTGDKITARWADVLRAVQAPR